MAHESATYDIPPVPQQLSARQYNTEAHMYNGYAAGAEQPRPQSAKSITRKPVASPSPNHLAYAKQREDSRYSSHGLSSSEDLDYRFEKSLSLSDNVHTSEEELGPQSQRMSRRQASEAGIPAHLTAEEETSTGSNLQEVAETPDVSQTEGLQYHAFDDDFKRQSRRITQIDPHSRRSSGSGGERSASQRLDVPPGAFNSRPNSAYSDPRGRQTASPLSNAGSDHGPLNPYDRPRSVSRHSPAVRLSSYVGELNNVPYSQQIAPGGSELHKSLQSIIGTGASLLDTKKTIDMYRANIKRDTEPSVQYEFAILMVNAAREATPDADLDAAELVTEAKHILQRLGDRAYPFAQYYLGDGYFSGLFNKDKPDYERAYALFVAASKHGHAEAGYRAALCSEFGWGTNKSYPKAYQFYRASASKNHPGAATRLGLACIHGDMGLSAREKYREGVKWLKRAQESADLQYNAAPYELGLLHLDGFGSDIFKDEPYAAQLFTQSAELGHVQANYLMGQAYETALYGCPKDAALSVHFYNGAASKGHPEAMMAICAWYMVGAEPVLEKDEGEAYAWALQAAETGYAKAEYAVGYFTEMGIGCRRDPLGANVWYVRAAEQGELKAKQRLQIIRAAAEGDANGGDGKWKTKEKKKFMGLF